MLKGSEMKELIGLFTAVLLVFGVTANDEDFEKIVDSLIKEIPNYSFFVGNKGGDLMKLHGYAQLSQGYNLSVEMTTITFGTLHYSQRSPGKPVDGFRNANFYQLEFTMDVLDPGFIDAQVYTSEPAGKSEEQCYLTSTCRNLITATFKEQLRVSVSLEYILVPGGRVKVTHLSLEKNPEYITKIDSCKISKTGHCNEFAAWIDKEMWPTIRFELTRAFTTVMEKISLPGM